MNPSAPATADPVHALHPFERDVLTADGRPVRVRPAVFSDAPRLQTFYDGLSDTSSYYRFFGIRRFIPPEELEAVLARGPLGPWWSEEVAACVLPLFAVGDDGLARARLPFEAHMAIVEDLLDTVPETVFARIGCPTWLVSCDGAMAEKDARTGAALDRAAELLALPLHFW